MFSTLTSTLEMACMFEKSLSSAAESSQYVVMMPLPFTSMSPLLVTYQVISHK